MPHVACYQLLTDGAALTLPNERPGDGETRDVRNIHWNPVHDGDLALDRSRRPVLCYRVEIRGVAEFRLRVQLRNGNAVRAISTRSFHGGIGGQFMDPFPAQWLRSGSNGFLFRRLSGGGEVFIHDVMVLYQRLVS